MSGTSIPIPLGPVKLVGILRENESSNGLDKMMEKAQDEYGILDDKMQDLICPAFEKAAEISKMIE